MFIGGPFLLTLISLAYSIYLSRYLESMLAALINCPYIVFRAGLRHQGWFGRLMLLATITGMVMWPAPGIRAGVMDPVDIENFPPHLKRLLKIKSVILISIFVWALSGYVLIKFK
jgi:hypothetical protein